MTDNRTHNGYLWVEIPAIDLSNPDTRAAMREVARVLDLLTRQYEKAGFAIVGGVPIDSVRFARLVAAQDILESKLREE